MLQPKRTKYRAYHKGKCGGVRTNLQELHFGKYALKCLESGRISAKGIEAVRRTLTRTFRRRGTIWTRIFPDIAVSKKPAEVRMGKGKGSIDYWMCRVQAGHILFEMDGISEELAREASILASHKLSFRTHFISR